MTQVAPHGGGGGAGWLWVLGLAAYTDIQG